MPRLVLALLLTVAFAFAGDARAQQPCGGILQPACPEPTTTPTPEPTATPTPSTAPAPAPEPSAAVRDRRARAAVRRIHADALGADRRTRAAFQRFDPDGRIGAQLRNQIRILDRSARVYRRCARQTDEIAGASTSVRNGLRALRTYYRLGARVYGLFSTFRRTILRTDGRQGLRYSKRGNRILKRANPLRRQAQRQLDLRLR